MVTIVGIDPNNPRRRRWLASVSSEHRVYTPTPLMMARHLRMLGIPREEIVIGESQGEDAEVEAIRTEFWTAWEQGPEQVPGYDAEGDATLHWDVSYALRDIAFDMMRQLDENTSPDRERISEWFKWLSISGRLHHRLEHACEDVVEEGASPEHLTALERALARAQGQENYWRRKDRW